MCRCVVGLQLGTRKVALQADSQAQLELLTFCVPRQTLLTLGVKRAPSASGRPDHNLVGRGDGDAGPYRFSDGLHPNALHRAPGLPLTTRIVLAIQPRSNRLGGRELGAAG
jgi:hypothetical protein